MERSYLVRYGLMSQVGRFQAEPEGQFERGQWVVVRSHRGTELGEVLFTELEGLAPSAGDAARVLRVADDGDMERARRAESERSARFDECRLLLESGHWPVELLDVEPLLDEGRLVLHYLGPHDLDVGPPRALFRQALRREVMFQAVGLGPEAEAEENVDIGCGGGDCGSGGGCGGSSGCDGCAVKQMMASGR